MHLEADNEIGNPEYLGKRFDFLDYVGIIKSNFRKLCGIKKERY